MACLHRHHIHSTCVVSFLVWAGCQLALRTNRLVLDFVDIRDVRLAPVFGGSLVDIVGETVA